MTPDGQYIPQETYFICPPAPKKIRRHLRRRRMGGVHVKRMILFHQVALKRLRSLN
ncbi:hypothetical protein KP509_23G009300 [Ceratopteris richardii]|nr:hypothetical protein KP509_23G009300 [Ceratopteris richardii]